MVSALGIRSARHVAFVALTALAIARPGGGLGLVGILFAAGSGVGWAACVFAANQASLAGPKVSGARRCR